ncbi:MAG: response regulator [Treponema sp.]|nr:response regulator [Treponema sp.]
MTGKRLFTLFLLFMGTFSLFSEKNYIKNPIKDLKIEAVEDEISKSIPISVSYCMDEELSLNCEDLDDIQLTSVSPSFYPGFYNGVIWLDISFLDRYINNESDLYLTFGNKHIDLAEVYIKKSYGWHLLGRTGRGIRRKQMSDPFRDLIVQISEAELSSNTYHNLRVKLVSTIGAPVELKLLSKREFHNSLTVHSAVNFTLVVICFLVTVILLAYGIFCKESIYRLLSVSAMFMFLWILQLKGIGPVYLWNQVSLLNNSSRLVYFFTTGFFVLSTLLLVGIIREVNSDINGKSVVCFMISMSIICYVLTIFLSSPYVVFMMFNIAMMVNCILFLVMLFLNRKSRHSESFYILRFFIPVMIIVGGMQLLFLVRLFFNKVTLLNLSDYDNYYFDLCFFLMTVPALYGTFKKFGSRFNRMKTVIVKAAEKETEIYNERSLFFAMTSQLLTVSNLIHNAIQLPQLKTENDSIKEIYGVIERSSVQSIDYLNAMLIFGTKTNPLNTPLLLSSFFESCVDIIRSSAIRKDIGISISDAVDEEYVVRANRNILEMIFSNFMLTVVRCSKKNGTIDFALSQKENVVTLKTKFSVDQDDEQYMAMIFDESQDFYHKRKNEYLSESIGFRLVIKALQVYEGTFGYTKNSRSYTITMTMRFSEVDEAFNKEPVSVQTLFESETQKELNNSSVPVPVVDSIFSELGKTLVILLVEESIVSKRFWEDILNGQCIIKTTASGVEAWNYLHSADSPKPDVIFCNYNLPLMNGRELFRKCSDDENTRDIPFVFMLSPMDSGKREELLRRGVVDCLIRPYSKNEIYKTIYMIISLSNKIQHSILSQIDKAVRGQMNASPQQEYMQVQTPVMGNLTLTNAQTSIFIDSGLSSREQQIAILISHGKSDKEIADALNISPATVASHNKKIFRKLNVHSRVELMDKVR